MQNYGIWKFYYSNQNDARIVLERKIAHLTNANIHLIEFSLNVFCFEIWFYEISGVSESTICRYNLGNKLSAKLAAKVLNFAHTNCNVSSCFFFITICLKIRKLIWPLFEYIRFKRMEKIGENLSKAKVHLIQNCCCWIAS